MSYVLTLHVEEKGGQRGPIQLLERLSRSGEKGNRTDIGLGHAILSSAQRTCPIPPKSRPQPSIGKSFMLPPPPPQECKTDKSSTLPFR
jgi:hypothetical protein